jgi:hypothetical protein
VVSISGYCGGSDRKLDVITIINGRGISGETLNLVENVFLYRKEEKEKYFRR